MQTEAWRAYAGPSSSRSTRALWAGRAAAPARGRGAAGVTADSKRGAGPLVVLLLSAASVAGAALEPAATSAADYYTLADFQHVEKIDAHVHVHGRADRLQVVGCLNAPP